MATNSVTIYTEFVDSNLDKRYPLCESASSVIPDSFLGDLKLCIGAMDFEGEFSYRYNTRISQVRVYPDYIYVDIAYQDNTIGRSDPIPTSLRLSDSISSRSFVIHPTGSLPVNGTIVVGSCEDISKMVGVIDVPQGAGDVFPSNVIIMPDSVTSIVVDDRHISGDIVLEAGAGIDIQYEEASNTIKISAVTSDNEMTDEQFKDAIINYFGSPVLAISGVSPNADGNIDLTPTDCLMVEYSAENHAISFYNPCGEVCASEDFMEDTYDRIEDLNRSVSTLQSMYSSVANTLAQMGIRESAVLKYNAEQIAVSQDSNSKPAN